MISYFFLVKFEILNKIIANIKQTKKIYAIIDKQLLYVKHENRNIIFRIIPKAIPNKGFLNISDEKSSICCSKNPLFTTSLKGGRLYFIKYFK